MLRSLFKPVKGARTLIIAAALVVGALVGGSGCQPERPLKPVDSAQSRWTGKGAEPASAATKPDGLTTPAGRIETDAEGFVSLGSLPENDQPATAMKGAPATANATGAPAARLQAPQSAGVQPNSAAAVTLELVGGNASSRAPGSLEIEPPTTIAAVPTAATLDKTPTATAPARSQESAPNFDDKKQAIAADWPEPQALLFITGQQHGYIEPCGCTGLENQKGGLNRRDTLLTLLRQRGWNVIPMDVGNFERRTGIQAEMKLRTTVKALTQMEYQAATLGVDDLKLSSQELLEMTASDNSVQTPFISANAYILIEEVMPKVKVIQAGGRKIGVTAVLGDSFAEELKGATEVILSPAIQSLQQAIQELQRQNCDYYVLLSHAKLAESRQYAVEVPGFDLIVSAGDFPEPDFRLEAVEGSSAKLVQVGAKGMFTALVGLYPDNEQPVRYQRVALSSQFADSPRMMKLFAEYQQQLEHKGFDGLRVPVQALPDGLRFVGSEACGDCHTQAFEVWKNSAHFSATESLVHPPNSRSEIPRHFDPECLSCHVTGWNPQRYYPYSSGYQSLESTPMLTGNGCENCHGAGSAHVAAESGDTQLDEAMLVALRQKMRLPLSEAKERCLQCHDQDNSPDFQHEGAFEEYWQQIAHPGKD